MKIDPNGKILSIANLQTNESYSDSYNFKLKSIDEDLIALSLSYPANGYILWRLNENFQLIWSETLASNPNVAYCHSKLTVDKNIYVWTPNKKQQSSVHIFNQDGRKIIKKDKVEISLDFKTSMTDDKNYFYFSEKSKRDQKIHVKAIDKTTFQTEWEQQYSFHSLEHINTLMVHNDLLVMGGASGYTQAKGGSLLSYSNAMLVFLEKKNGILSKMKNNPFIFGTKRKDEIITLLPINNDEFLVGGMENGPITHDSAKSSYSTGFMFKVKLH